jgi:hypothetical protein
MRDKFNISALCIPLLFAIGVLGTGLLLVILDFIFNLGLS